MSFENTYRALVTFYLIKFLIRLKNNRLDYPASESHPYVFCDIRVSFRPSGEFFLGARFGANLIQLQQRLAFEATPRMVLDADFNMSLKKWIEWPFFLILYNTFLSTSLCLINRTLILI